jgi:twitching motility two-component system response regulator PilG
MPKLLLADDSLTTQKVVKLTFADEGIEVISAEDGDTALQLVSQQHPDIVLADVNMPGLNGYEVCEIIRKREESRGTPVVLLVGSFEPFDLEEARRVGATEYLTKPFSSIRKLVTTVFDLLNAPKPAGEASTEAPDESKHQPEEPMSDIEVLYQESFAETLEMPADDSERGDFGDPALDDELIETTYKYEAEAESPAPVDETPSTEEQRSAPAEIERPLATEAAAGRESTASAVAEERTEQRPESDSATPEPIEEEPLSFEEPRDEAYFEPEEAETTETLTESAASTESDETVQTDEIPGSDFPKLAEAAPGNETAIGDDVGPRSAESEPAPSEDEPPMPWDSLAEPPDMGFDFDDGDLLELPVGGRITDAGPAPSYEKAGRNDQMLLTPELVDRIVRLAALRISEEFGRQIAERVVPQVVEEVLAKRPADEPEG